jgi:CubicO group peptidase (beta-lactamase class C family)
MTARARRSLRAAFACVAAAGTVSALACAPAYGGAAGAGGAFPAPAERGTGAERAFRESLGGEVVWRSAPSAARVAAAAPSPREVAPESVGFSAARLARVDSIMNAALSDGAAPGAALVIGRRGQVVRLRGYGRTDWTPGAPLVTDSTLYDLASLTKAMGTATVAMQLVRENRLRLDAPLFLYLRDWPDAGAHAQITIRHLLAHTSGLPAGFDVWRTPGTRSDRIASLARLPMRTRPGAERNYSDVGMILLGAVLEEVTGSRLDDLLHVRVFGPLEMRDTRFNPLAPIGELGAFALAQIAPTERDRFVRRTLVHGVVHDLNAWAMEGIAGHAGLFSSARDMAVYGQTLLDAARGHDTPIFAGTSFIDWVRNERSFGRPLGWDVPTGQLSSAGVYFSRSSIGHTGFTGTSLWVDPERELFVVLLTNRLNPTAANQKHVKLRRDLHDAVQLAIVDMSIVRRE